MEKKAKINSKKALIYIAAGIICLLIILAVFRKIVNLINTPTSVFTVVKDKVQDGENTLGYILRKEKVLGNEESGKLDKIKAEGEKVSKGDNVFRYYSQEEQKVLEQIEQLEKDIEKQLVEYDINLNSPENIVIDANIEVILNEVAGLTNQKQVEKFSKNIDEDLLKKAKNSGEFSKEGSKVKKLIEQKNKLEKGLNDKTKIITAPFAGVITYKIDGYENKLKTGNFEYINKEFLKNIDIRPGTTINISDTNCKIIDNFEMYIACISTSENAKTAKVGDRMKLDFGAYISRVEIVDIKKTGKEYIIVFKTNDNVEKSLGNRVVNVRIIWWEEEGLKIANEAIEKIQDYYQVTKNEGDYTKKVIVKVVKQSEDYALVENYTTEELKNLGVDLTGEKPNIKEYDEILILNKKNKEITMKSEMDKQDTTEEVNENIDEKVNEN